MMIRIHPSAEVDTGASIGDGTTIWHHAQVRAGASVGRNCILGKGVYLDSETRIGNYVKIQNYVSVFAGVVIEDGAFIGPHVCFTNDLYPRSITPSGKLKSTLDWQLIRTHIAYGASLGANTTILCGIRIGAWAMVGAGSVVVDNVPAHGLVIGNPSHLIGFVCYCGLPLSLGAAVQDSTTTDRILICTKCRSEVRIPQTEWDMLP